MADDTNIFDGLLTSLTPQPKNIGWQGDFVKALNKGASDLGVSARDLGLALSYETERTFDSAHQGRGPAKGRYGLLQVLKGGEEEQKYGFSPSQTPAEQVDSVVQYLRDRGLQPGMGLKDIYSTINAGKPGLYNASDRPGETVSTHVARMSDPNGMYAKATDALLSGTKPVAAADDDSWAKGLELPASLEPPQLTPAGSPAGAPLTPNSGASWGGWTDFANKLLLGGGTPIMAGAQAGKEAMREVTTGVPISQAISSMPSTYGQAKDAYEQAQEQWAKENPGQDLTNLLVGATIPTVGALAATEGTAAPAVGDALAAIAPRAGPQVAKFLAGEAGAGGTGFLNKLLQLGSQATRGALEGSAAGGMQTGLTKNSMVDDMLSGAEFGGAANPILKKFAPAIKSLFDVTVTRPVATIAQKAKNLGIDLTGAQLTGDQGVRALAAKAGALGNDAQLGQYTRAVSKEFGEDTPVITKDVLESAKTRIGQDFEHVANSVTKNIGDNDFMRRLTLLRTDALNAAGGNLKDPTYLMVKGWVGNMGRAAQNGLLDGQAFASYTRGSSAFSRGMLKSPDANLRHYGGEIYAALQDALGRNAPSDVMDTWKTAKQQWAAMKQIEPIAEKSWPSGVINPQQMAGLRGSNTGNLNDLAQIGQLMPKTVPTGGVKPSGAAGLINNLLARVPGGPLLGAGAAGGAGLHYGPHILNQIAANPITSAAAGVAAAGNYAVNKYIQKLMLDPRYAEILMARGLAQPGPGMPLGASAIQAAQGSAIPMGTELLNQEQPQ